MPPTQAGAPLVYVGNVTQLVVLPVGDAALAPTDGDAASALPKSAALGANDGVVAIRRVLRVSRHGVLYVCDDSGERVVATADLALFVAMRPIVSAAALPSGVEESGAVPTTPPQVPSGGVAAPVALPRSMCLEVGSDDGPSSAAPAAGAAAGAEPFRFLCVFDTAPALASFSAVVRRVLLERGAVCNANGGSRVAHAALDAAPAASLGAVPAGLPAGTSLLDPAPEATPPTATAPATAAAATTSARRPVLNPLALCFSALPTAAERSAAVRGPMPVLAALDADASAAAYFGPAEVDEFMALCEGWRRDEAARDVHAVGRALARATALARALQRAPTTAFAEPPPREPRRGRLPAVPPPPFAATARAAVPRAVAAAVDFLRQIPPAPTARAAATEARARGPLPGGFGGALPDRRWAGAPERVADAWLASPRPSGSGWPPVG